MHEYKLAEFRTSAGLSREITGLMAEGWDLWGNPFGVEAEYDGDVRDIHFFQAVVRQVAEEKPVENILTEMVDDDLKLPQLKPAGYTVQVPETPMEGEQIYCAPVKLQDTDGQMYGPLKIVQDMKLFFRGPLCSCKERYGDNPDCTIHDHGHLSSLSGVVS